MKVGRRTWLYRLAGQKRVQAVPFRESATTFMARRYLRHAVSNPFALLGRSICDEKWRARGAE
jgi:hypothetical protein